MNFLGIKISTFSKCKLLSVFITHINHQKLAFYSVIEWCTRFWDVDFLYSIRYLKICRDKIRLRSEASLNSFVMRMIYFDSHFWFLSCHCCCILHPCNFAQLAVLNINQSHMFMSFCQMTTANSSIIPLGNQHVPSISISLLYQGFRGQSHCFMKLRGNC